MRVHALRRIRGPLFRPHMPRSQAINTHFARMHGHPQTMGNPCASRWNGLDRDTVWSGLRGGEKIGKGRVNTHPRAQHAATAHRDGVSWRGGWGVGGGRYAGMFFAVSLVCGAVVTHHSQRRRQMGSSEHLASRRNTPKASMPSSHPPLRMRPRPQTNTQHRSWGLA